MGFLRKLKRFEHDLNEMFPDREREEREPTIAEDYPQKWPEIQRKQLINKAIWIAVGLSVMLLIIARLCLGAVAVNHLYRSIWPFGPILVSLAFVVLLYSTNTFQCPRCRKTFQSYSRYDFLNDARARCQHCNLKMGEAPKSMSVR